jgi:hypothetical protein
VAEIVAIVRSIIPDADIAVGPGGYAFQPGVPAIRKEPSMSRAPVMNSAMSRNSMSERGLEAHLAAEFQVSVTVAFCVFFDG